MQFEFRPLLDDDLPTMHRWLNDPEVVRWWEGDDVTWNGVVRDYSPHREPEPVDHWIAAVEGVDVGWISCSTLADWPEEASAWTPHGVDLRAGTIDYLIGDSVPRRRGVGSEMIRRFVAQIGFGLHPDWSQVAVAPMAANKASWRALENAGFVRRAIVADPLAIRS